MAKFIRWSGSIGFAIFAWVAASPAGAVTVTDTTVAQFNAGTPGACYVAETTDGEVLLPPTQGAEFFGSALPAGWASFDWGSFYGPPAGSVTVGSGVVTVDRARVNPEPIPGGDYGPGRSMEAVVMFTSQKFQHVGFGAGSHTEPGGIFDTFPVIMFSTGMAGTQVQARYGNGPLTEVDLGSFCSNSTCLNQTHRYRIDWTASTVEFFIDGVSVHGPATVTLAGPMRPAISDFDTGVSFDTDWLRMTPYGSPCSYASAVINGGNAGADWTTLVAASGLPPGTGVSFQTRTGPNPTPGGLGWSAFQALSGTTILSPTAQYLQYRATLSTTDVDETPELQAVAVSYAACTPSGPEVCGNAIDEDCDGQDGVCPPTPTPTETPVPATPTPTATPLCGNGNVDSGAGEQCDDGNTVSGDCCSSTCQIEPLNQPCDDHNTCTTGSKCNGVGVCVGFTACNTTLTCNVCGSKCTQNGSVCKCG